MDRIELKIEHYGGENEYFITPWFDTNLKMVVENKTAVILDEHGRGFAEFKYKWVPREEAD